MLVFLSVWGADLWGQGPFQGQRPRQGGFSQNGPGPSAIPGFHATPLTDMKPGDRYQGFAGGLYEGGNAIPDDHQKAGLAQAAAMQPLDRNGKPSPNGAIVFLSIGMSNTIQEFDAFMGEAAGNGRINRSNLALVEGAKGGVSACLWTLAEGTAPCPGPPQMVRQNQFDRVRDEALANGFGPAAPSGCGGGGNPCFTEKQVQVVWLKNANPGPGVMGYQPLCDAAKSGCKNDSQMEAVRFESQMGDSIRAAMHRYPNLKQVFISSRTYGGYASKPLNPEPFAYEYGYSVKWLVQAQIAQLRTGKADPVAGDINYKTGTAPWIAWGPYLWADGHNRRADGLVWDSSDVREADGTHPSDTGRRKVADLLMEFFLKSPLTPWFRK